MKFIRWLETKEAEKMPEREDSGKKKPKKNSALVEKMNEIENGVTVGETTKSSKSTMFIHEETGKEYKTERALKAGITRYNKKQKDKSSTVHLEELRKPKVRTEHRKLAKKMIGDENIITEEKVGAPIKFIDEETGKEYKTERALKAGITRRLNKQKSEEK